MHELLQLNFGIGPGIFEQVVDEIDVGGGFGNALAFRRRLRCAWLFVLPLLFPLCTCVDVVVEQHGPVVAAECNAEILVFVGDHFWYGAPGC